VIIYTRNFLFEKGIFKSNFVNAKVISVGNLTVGGSGKTPTVIFVTNKLKEAGKKVGILSRGYGRNSKGYLLISKYDGPEKDVEISGDEMFLMASETMVPTAVAERRVNGAVKLISDTKINTLVLDDAYQHRWIKRDLDLLMFDQRFLVESSWMDKKLLPLGIMREPFSSIKRADVVIINRKFSNKNEIPEKLLKYFKGKTIFYAKYAAAGIYDVKTHQQFEIEEFQGQNSLVVCGIAKPFSFLNVLNKNHINTKNKMIFTDHKNYTFKEITGIRKKFYDSNSHSVLTTQKDAVKLIKFSKELDDIDIYYLKIELKIDNENNFEKLLFDIYN
jgi:tetraacyldisaccharide 4'-kinase